MMIDLAGMASPLFSSMSSGTSSRSNCSSPPAEIPLRMKCMRRVCPSAGAASSPGAVDGFADSFSLDFSLGADLSLGGSFLAAAALEGLAVLSAAAVVPAAAAIAATDSLLCCSFADFGALLLGLPSAASPLPASTAPGAAEVTRSGIAAVFFTLAGLPVAAAAGSALGRFRVFPAAAAACVFARVFLYRACKVLTSMGSQSGQNLHIGR
mmetsp:Transcript_35470/g.89009  ORF Transcript_35470/g.89009 Transcript_35470/m.89009 type:complete len:210 (-) Transcript_35470:1513-2142(-)